jgi:AAA+ superfamily predicted ATPase
MSEAVIAALLAALQQSPEQTDVRLHLAEMLLLQGSPGEALEHAQVVLALQPDSIQALTVAQEACQSLGQSTKAQAYRRLLTAALGTEPTGRSDVPNASSAAAEPVAAGGHADGTTDVGGLGTDEPDHDQVPRRSDLTFADIGGMQAVKSRLEMSLLGPLRNPELRAYYGKETRGGLLLYGPPGCGKTYIAAAVAGELGSAFLPVGLSDVLDMWLGNSEKQLHQIFEYARRHTPCVLFLDELDALGRKRSQLANSAGRNVINQLLMEMDGVRDANDGVFVLAATNHPWDVDVALRRPGRLDRSVLVLPPDRQAREAILAHHMQQRPQQSIDLAKLAARTDLFSGADLKHLCETAAEYALQDSMHTGRMRPIGSGDFDRALKEVSSSIRAWFTVAHSYAVYANEGGQYDDLLAYIKENKLL